MDNRPIGVFDSGLGGLTCVKELMHVLPGENIIYLGDTGRVPYGTRSNETIIQYALEGVAFLEKFDVKRIIIACGTDSTVAMEQLRQHARFATMGVLEVTSAKAVALTKNKKVGVIATSATTRSQAFRNRLLQLDPEISVYANACPLFVPLVENGYIEDDNPVTHLVAEEYLAPLREAGIDTLIMGCTHYPVIAGCIARSLPGVALVDPGKEAAISTADILAKENGKSEYNAGTNPYYVTDSTEGFSSVASIFLDREITESVERIVL